MSEAAVVDRQDVRVRLGAEGAVGVCSPALGDVAGVAVDFFEGERLVRGWVDLWRPASPGRVFCLGLVTQDKGENGHVQFTTTLASESFCKRSMT